MLTHKSRLRRRRLAECFRRNPAPFCAVAIACIVGCNAALQQPVVNEYMTTLWLQCSAFFDTAAQALSKLSAELNIGQAEPQAAPDNTAILEEAPDEHVPAVTVAAPSESQNATVPAVPLVLAQFLPSEKTVSPIMTPTLTEPTALQFKNCTDYTITPAKILSNSSGIQIDSSGPQVLVIHTHGSEAYTQSNNDVYTESDPYRTTDNRYNMVRIGDELCSILESRGIQTVHDETLFDYPNYNDSYSRSMEAIEGWLEEYPSIKIVLDLHRDAIEYSDGSAYKTECTVNGESSAQILIISGTNDSGLYHPNWEENLAFGFTLQSAMDAAYPGLTRPLKISQYRYNMHATTGSLLIEVGSHGNTLQEALTAVRCFGNTLADVLLSA